VQGINLSITTVQSPNPVAVGSPVTLQLIVTNTGAATATNVVVTDQLPSTLTFNSASTSNGGSTSQANGLVTAQLGSLATGASAIASIVATPTTSGSLTATATVTGTGTPVTPANNTTTQSIIVVAAATPPASSDGPLVTNLVRTGFHSQQTNIVVTFNEALNATTATNVANYTLSTGSGKRHRKLPIRAVHYNATTHQVTIIPQNLISLKAIVTLVINGTTPTGVADTNGNLLDGTRSGTPGSNFTRTFSGFGPGAITS
jgi:uncharacterized repeat protein (TIGR01451 family)